jgi:hypothetical protein
MLGGVVTEGGRGEPPADWVVTTAVCAEVADADPYWLPAVILSRTVLPTSEAPTL